MSEERNKDIVRRGLQLVSDGDARGAAALYAPTTNNHGRKVSREDMVGVFESLIALHEQFAVHEIIAEGDWVACRVTVTGKYVAKPPIPVDSGIYSAIEPKGITFTFQHMHLFRVVDGEIVEHWANRDDLGAARQLGLELTPAPGKEPSQG